MDIFDHAQDLDLVMREQHIAKASQGTALPAIGVCYFCDEPLAHGHRFCDADCRDGWQAEDTARQRAGVVEAPETV